MPISPSAPALIEEHWEAAIASAGVNEADFHLLTVPGAAPANGNKAAGYPPTRVLFDEEDDLVRSDVLDEANEVEVRGTHQIAIYEEIDVQNPLERAIFAAKLRHEVRHAEQRMQCGQSLCSTLMSLSMT